MLNQNTHSITSVSIVIPVYNSQQILPALIDRLDNVLSSINLPYEIMVVNDYSHDNSWQVINKLMHQYPRLKGINLMRNYGQHNALLCGIRMAQYDVIVTMDDDLQHPPEEVSKLLNKLSEGYDVIYGIPQKEQHGLWRDTASQVTKLALQGILGTKIARNVSAFRAFRTMTRDGFANYQSPFVSIDVLLTWGAARFGSVVVSHYPRESGMSNYSFRKLVRHAINMITGFSVLPLQLASAIGFVFTLLGLGVLSFVIGRYLIEGGSVPGFPFLASIITIFSGAQLFTLGIIGEYLARMYVRTLGRPYCVIRETKGFSSTQEGNFE